MDCINGSAGVMQLDCTNDLAEVRQLDCKIAQFGRGRQTAKETKISVRGGYELILMGA